MSAPTFVEHQRLGRWWLWVLVLLAAATSWWGFIAQVILDAEWTAEPVPDASLVVAVIIVGILLPAVLAVGRLVVRVDAERLVVRLGPLPPREVPREEIREVELTDRSASAGLAAGVGARPAEQVYAAREGPGVRVHLHNGRRIVLGSRRPEELAAALAPEDPSAEGSNSS